MTISSRWKIILIAAAFNLLLEYSLRGINNIPAQPFLPFVLFISYFTYFTMLEDLIIRFKLKDFHLMAISFFYGTIYLAFVSGILFIPPLFLGIRWGSMLFVNLVWWGAVQAVMTFYLANRLAKRNWQHGRMSKTGWAVMLFLNFLVILIFKFGGQIPNGTPIGYAAFILILFFNLLLIWKIWPKEDALKENLSFRKSNFMDILSFLTVALFVFSAIFLTFDPIRSLTSNVNQTALNVISWWSLIAAILMLVHRILSKKSISV